MANKGIPGLNGKDGKTILSGSVAPVSGIGVDGDFYIRKIEPFAFYVKESGAWVSLGNLKVSDTNGNLSSMIQDVYENMYAAGVGWTTCSAATLSYAVNVIAFTSQNARCAKLPQPVQGKSVRLVNTAESPIKLYPSNLDGIITPSDSDNEEDALKNGVDFITPVIIPNDSKVYEFICTSSSNGGSWFWKAAATQQRSTFQIDVSHTNGSNTYAYTNGAFNNLGTYTFNTSQISLQGVSAGQTYNGYYYPPLNIQVTALAPGTDTTKYLTVQMIQQGGDPKLGTATYENRFYGPGTNSGNGASWDNDTSTWGNWHTQKTSVIRETLKTNVTSADLAGGLSFSSIKFARWAYPIALWVDNSSPTKFNGGWTSGPSANPPTGSMVPALSTTNSTVLTGGMGNPYGVGDPGSYQRVLARDGVFINGNGLGPGWPSGCRRPYAYNPVTRFFWEIIIPSTFPTKVYRFFIIMDEII